jgi:hypothetical protein
MVCLIAKTACAEQWALQFSGEAAKKGVQNQIFPWFLTRDACSTRVTIPFRHPHFLGGLAYYKFYNIQEDLFSTLIKNVVPFGLPAMEDFAVTLDTLNRWRNRNAPGAARNTLDKLIHAYISTKERLHAGLLDSLKAVFSVRQEWRIRLALFEFLIDYDPVPPPLTEATTPRHPTYWNLSTEHVGQFIRSEINRWLLPLEYYVSKVAAHPAAPPSLDIELEHAAVVLICIRVLRMGYFMSFPQE